MLPVLEGVIARRILLNFRVDPEIAQRNIPSSLKVEIRNGHAIAGICLIRLEHLRPKHMPAFLGISSENMAHRIAIEYPTEAGFHPGVFIWSRETDQKLVQALGGRLFPGVHHTGIFDIIEGTSFISMDVHTGDGKCDVRFSANQRPWTPTRSFDALRDASDFFAKGDCGFSCSLRGDELEGMRLKTIAWQVQPLTCDYIEARFFEDPQRFPPGCVEFDCGLIMRGVQHEWHELQEIPNLVATGVS